MANEIRHCNSNTKLGFLDGKTLLPTEAVSSLAKMSCRGIFFYLLFFPTVCFANIAVDTIALEAGNQSFAGQVAVARVIKTRMAERHQTAEQVCLAPKQFSCWNGKHRKLTAQEIAVAQEAWNQATVWQYNHYCRFDCKPSWAKKAKKSIRIGDHVFYELR